MEQKSRIIGPTLHPIASSMASLIVFLKMQDYRGIRRILGSSGRERGGIAQVVEHAPPSTDSHPAVLGWHC